MSLLRKRKYGVVLLVAVLMICAVCSRVAARYGYYAEVLSIVRALIYIGLLAAWGISVQTRIIQTQVRRYLLVIAGLMLLWLTLRTVKYNTYHMTAERFLWYGYYLPMLFIPVLAVLVALSLGKPENYRLPKWTHFLYLPSALLFLLVLTNDLHQLVFFFPTGVLSTREYDYGIGYYVVLAWMVLCAAAALVIILAKCRIPQSRRYLWLPVVPFALALGYCAAYIKGVYWVWLLAGDLTVSMCLIITAIFESCIQCSLIQSNTHYAELFHASTIGALITDRDFSVACAAENARSVDSQTLMAAAESPVVTADGIRISEAPIRWGHVFWEDDISPMLAVLKELDDTREELQSYGSILQAENAQKARRKKLEEQERLYRAMQEKAAAPAVRLSNLAKALQGVQDADAARFLLWKMTVIGAYLKRRSNLIFLADRDGMVPVSEVALCLNESMDNLRLHVRRCASRLDFEGELRLETAAALYDFFEAAIELAMDDLSGAAANVTRKEDACVLSLMLQCGTDLTSLRAAYPGMHSLKMRTASGTARCPSGKGGTRHETKPSPRHQGERGQSPLRHLLCRQQRRHHPVQPADAPSLPRPDGPRPAISGRAARRLESPGRRRYAGGCRQQLPAIPGRRGLGLPGE